MAHHSTKYEKDGSITEWESPDGKHWQMVSQRYPERERNETRSRGPLSFDPLTGLTDAEIELYVMVEQAKSLLFRWSRGAHTKDGLTKIRAQTKEFLRDSATAKLARVAEERLRPPQLPIAVAWATAHGLTDRYPAGARMQVASGFYSGFNVRIVKSIRPRFGSVYKQTIYRVTTDSGTDLVLNHDELRRVS